MDNMSKNAPTDLNKIIAECGVGSPGVYTKTHIQPLKNLKECLRKMLPDHLSRKPGNFMVSTEVRDAFAAFTDEWCFQIQMEDHALLVYMFFSSSPFLFLPAPTILPPHPPPPCPPLLSLSLILSLSILLHVSHSLPHDDFSLYRSISLTLSQYTIYK